jgi:hypothetical protein
LGYLSGITTQMSSRTGLVAFKNMSAFCYPGGNLTVRYSATIPGTLTTSVVRKVTYTFRPCVDGELLVGGNECAGCPGGSYSLLYDPMATTCTPCPAGTAGCAGNTIAVAPGSWRVSPYSTVMLACPLPRACGGGDGSAAAAGVGTGRRLQAVVPTFSSGCSDGYTGPLCAVCAFGFYLDTQKQVRGQQIIPVSSDRLNSRNTHQFLPTCTTFLL